jgi:hypothetical protein
MLLAVKVVSPQKLDVTPNVKLPFGMKGSLVSHKQHSHRKGTITQSDDLGLAEEIVPKLKVRV